MSLFQLGVQGALQQPPLRRVAVLRTLAEPFDPYLVDLDNRSRGLAPPVQVRVPEDGQQPGLQVRSRAKMPRPPQRPKIGVLNEVFRLRRVPRQPSSCALDGPKLRRRVAVECLRPG
jgi:hypothetical protein